MGFAHIIQNPAVRNALLAGASAGAGVAARRIDDLQKVASGEKQVDPSSRLGAFKASLGNDSGTVGHSVNGAIGFIYVGMGTVGEERIGDVFNSAQAKELYKKPVDSPASLQMAEQEFSYWSQIKRDKPWSVGGQLGSAFTPPVRDKLQQHVFSKAP